jgi:hypothetical protein
MLLRNNKAKYNLTFKQKQILKILVENVKSGKVEEPIIPSCSLQDCEIIGIEGSFDSNLLGDLDVLCEAGLLAFRYNSQGDKIYTLKQSGYEAVGNDFITPETPLSAQINIGAIIHEMKNGNVQAVGFSSQSEIQQIVNDPELLREKVDDLANQLLDAIKTELPADRLLAYMKNVEELKKQLDDKKPSVPILEEVFRALSFIGDVEGTISFMARVWPYVYPLLIIAVEKIKLLAG